MTTRQTASVLLVSLAAVFTCQGSHAAPFVPAGLSPGDKYHLVFITDGLRDATSSSIADYNNFVQGQAALNPGLTGTNMGVVYKAIASTTAIDANVNAPVSATVYNFNGDKIADDVTDMWDGSIDNPIAYTQFVTTVFPPDIWTGSTTAGLRFVGNELGQANPRTGRSDLADGRWIDEIVSNSSFNSRFYGLSQELVVPGVPAPSSFVLAAFAMLPVGAISYRRRRGGGNN